MSSKVLLADDSLTIQKVVSITFTNEPLELTTCNSHDELENHLKSGEFELLLLDFNLDENTSGYDICSKAKEISPGISVVILYGTFDTIVEEQLKEHKVDAHIVKPFDGGKFLNLCKDLLRSKSTQPKNSLADINIVDTDPNINAQVQTKEEAEEENWNISENVTQASSNELTSTTEISREEKSQLLRDVESWGIDVPPIISDFESADDFSVEFPPVINGKDSNTETFNIELGTSQELNALSTQAEDDLESAVYDEFDNEKTEIISELKADTESGDDISLVDISGEAEEPSTLELNNTSVEDNFVVQESTSEEQELTNEDLWADDEDYEPEASEDNQVVSSEDPAIIESDSSDVEMDLQAADELEIEQKDDPSAQTKIIEKDGENTHSAVTENAKKDSSGFVQLDLAQDIHEGTGELQLSDVDPSNSLSEPEEENIANANGEQSASQASIASRDEIRAMVEGIVRDVVREELDKVFSNGVDKVAWEIIPDLAENLIKNQLQTISDKILEE